MSIESHKEYIKVKLQTLLNEFASAAISYQPENIDEFSLDWLKNFRKSTLSIAEKEELKELRSELEKLNSEVHTNNEE